MLWWNGEAGFFVFVFVSFFLIKEKNWLHQNVLCWRKYELIFAALYILQMTIRKRKLLSMRSKMLFPFDHKQYLEADKRQLRSKVSRQNFSHKNKHVKHQGFPKSSWQYGQ